MEKHIKKWVDYIYYKQKENEIRMLVFDFDALERNHIYMLSAYSKLINLIRIFKVLYGEDKYSLLKQRAEQMKLKSEQSLKILTQNKIKWEEKK